MTQLVQAQPVVVQAEQDAGAVVAQPAPAGFRADVLGISGGTAVRAGAVFRQEQRPRSRPAIRRGSRWAVSVPQVIHMTSPPWW